VRELLAAHALVVPTCEGEQGHPVGFARQHFRALAGLSGERGARALIEAERARCLFLETGDPGVVADVDTPEQLAYWRALLLGR
jgi:molybdenum cofactor cytidylyltransferase